MTRADIERLLHRSGWPVPPVDLRARVLAATPTVDRRVTWSDRVWFSRAWRLAAAATLVGAVAIDASSQSGANGGETPTGIALAEVLAIDDAGHEIDLPSNLAAALGRRALVVDAGQVANDRQRLAIEDLETNGGRR